MLWSGPEALGSLPGLGRCWGRVSLLPPSQHSSQHTEPRRSSNLHLCKAPGDRPRLWGARQPPRGRLFGVPPSVQLRSHLADPVPKPFPPLFPVSNRRTPTCWQWQGPSLRWSRHGCGRAVWDGRSHRQGEHLPASPTVASWAAEDGGQWHIVPQRAVARCHREWQGLVGSLSVFSKDTFFIPLLSPDAQRVYLFTGEGRFALAVCGKLCSLRFCAAVFAGFSCLSVLLLLLLMGKV